MLSTSPSAPVFNVVHGSFVDGWGIRTTILLKGCPLRCLWCCNPESQRREPELQVIDEHCSGCGRCISRCPKGALSLQNGTIAVDRTHCDGCSACVRACWPGALQIWGKLRTADDVFAECLRDRSFYAQSGGGVTLSGGEPTQHPEFCLEMLRLCHEAGIPVAVDTCGQVTTEAGLAVLRQADLLLFDVKGLDPEVHRRNTGIDNRVIQKNLLSADKWGKDIIIRYPVIPHHNLREAEAIAELISTLGHVRRIDLIFYHQYGTGKYTQLGREYLLREDPVPEEEQSRILQLFSSRDLPVQVGG